MKTNIKLIPCTVHPEVTLILVSELEIDFCLLVSVYKTNLCLHSLAPSWPLDNSAAKHKFLSPCSLTLNLTGRLLELVVSSLE